jgi:hypothetical protein
VRTAAIAEALAVVAEGHCPLCHVALIVHADRACCPCGGCSYRLEGERLEMIPREGHPAVRCEHWETVWLAMPPTPEF